MRRVGSCLAGFAALLVSTAAAAGAQDDNQYRSAEVAGWEVVQPELTEPGPFDSVIGASMRRRSDGYFIEYEVKGGLRRHVGVQRLSCGEATDENGGVLYSDSVYMNGSVAEVAAAMRAAVREADSGFDDACPARPAQLEAALAGLETALETVEQWARERPLPAADAWERGNMSIERREPPVTIRYGMPPGEDGVRLLGMDVDGCGEPYGFSEEVRLTAGADAAARARAALDRLLRQASQRCRLAAGQAERLPAGFEEAAARLESEF